MTDRQLELKSWQYRRDVLRHIKQAGAGHTGGSLSCVDILNVLYNRILNVTPETFHDPNRGQEQEQNQCRPFQDRLPPDQRQPNGHFARPAIAPGVVGYQSEGEGPRFLC